jgi:hypothetical protein
VALSGLYFDTDMLEGSGWAPRPSHTLPIAGCLGFACEVPFAFEWDPNRGALHLPEETRQSD